jgi:hypothetical protein
MVEQLQILTNKGKIQTEDVPEITTVKMDHIICGKFEKTISNRKLKVAEGNSIARNIHNFQEMEKSSSKSHSEKGKITVQDVNSNNKKNSREKCNF